MELKLVYFSFILNGNVLLIVPYGIETLDAHCLDFITSLLIVPYGIETTKKINIMILAKLLIVPYGIETTL